MRNIISKNHIYLRLDLRDRDAIIDHLAENMGLGEDMKAFAHGREAQCSTGLDGVCAIPHCRSEEITSVRCAVAILTDKIQWDDKSEVQIVIFTAAPLALGAYIRNVVKIVKVLSVAEARIRLINATSVDEAYDALVNPQSDSN
jgi:PTS system fructose-specific IIC component